MLGDTYFEHQLPSSRLFGQYHHCFDTHGWTLLLNRRKRHAHLFQWQQWEQRLSKPFGWLLWTFGFPKAFVTSAMNYGTWAIFIFISENLCFPPVIPQKFQFPSHQIGWGRMTVSPWVYLLSFLTVDTASPILQEVTENMYKQGDQDLSFYCKLMKLHQQVLTDFELFLRTFH